VDNPWLAFLGAGFAGREGEPVEAPFVNHPTARVPVLPVGPCSTSQTCSTCGHRTKANRKSRGEFVCRSCGRALPADHKAARNVRAGARRCASNPGKGTPSGAPSPGTGRQQWRQTAREMALDPSPRNAAGLADVGEALAASAWGCRPQPSGHLARWGSGSTTKGMKRSGPPRGVPGHR
jgi:hypothetical protein